MPTVLVVELVGEPVAHGRVDIARGVEHPPSDHGVAAGELDPVPALVVAGAEHAAHEAFDPVAAGFVEPVVRCLGPLAEGFVHDEHGAAPLGEPDGRGDSRRRNGRGRRRRRIVR